jgi:DNA invertase Pin-like site-specific DNA recombinase
MRESVKASKSRYGELLAYDQRPELQEEPLRQLAGQRGWTVTRVYTDRMSGARDNRPALAELLADARAAKFEVVLLFRFDRLGRSALHFLKVVEELRSLRVDLVSFEQSFDTTTAMGRFTLTMFAALAELERSIIKQRTLAGLDYARNHGTKSGRPIGRPPAVFRRDQVCELRAQGCSWREIAARLGTTSGAARRAFEACVGACRNPSATVTSPMTETKQLSEHRRSTIGLAETER